MSCDNFLLFLVFVVSLNSVQSKEICDFSDVKCITRGARNLYNNIIFGINGLIDPTDPINVGVIEGKIAPDLTYVLTNATMEGMKHCDVTQLLFYPNSTYKYDLFCPQLFLHYNYKAKGTLGPINLDGDGKVKVTLDDYLIVFKGEYEKFISENDQKPRIYIKSYVMETEPQGKVTFDVNNLVKTNKEKSDEAAAYINENWREMEKYLQSPTIEHFMKPFVEKMNICLKTFPLETLIPRE